jgi:hypothetical protein
MNAIPPVSSFAPAAPFSAPIVHASQDLFSREWTNVSRRIHGVADSARMRATN